MRRLTYLGLIMIITTATLAPILITVVSAQKPIRWWVVPNPYLTAQGRTRRFFVEILNTYVTQAANFTVVVTVPGNFTVTNPTQTGTLDPMAFKELVFHITASETVPIGVYPEAIQVSLDYTIAGASYHDALTPPATIEVREIKIGEWLDRLREWEDEWKDRLRTLKEEVVKQLSPSLQVSATPTSAEVKAGDSFDVTVVVNNVGTGPAKSVELTLIPPTGFSLRTSAVMTIESIDAGASKTIIFGLRTEDDINPDIYSPAISYKYVNALAKSLGLDTETKGTATFSVTVKEKSFIEQYTLLIIVAIVAVVIVAVIALVARKRK